MSLTVQEMAKARVAASWEKMVERQSCKSPSKPVKEEPKKKLTPKESQVSRDARYYRNHKEKVKNNLKEFRKNFKEKYGVTYNACLYWIKKIDDGLITLKDLPEKYKTPIRHYYLKKSVAERG